MQMELAGSEAWDMYFGYNFDILWEIVQHARLLKLISRRMLTRRKENKLAKVDKVIIADGKVFTCSKMFSTYSIYFVKHLENVPIFFTHY